MPVVNRSLRTPRRSWLGLALGAALLVSACGQAGAPTIALPTLRVGPSGMPLAPATAGPSTAAPAPASNAPSQDGSSPAPLPAASPAATEAPRPTAQPSPSVAPTPAPTPAPTAAPTASVVVVASSSAGPSVTELQVSAEPSAVATAEPSAAPTESPVLSALQVWTGDGPNAAEKALLTHVPDGLFATCARLDAPWPDQSASINCQSLNLGVSYGSFPTQAKMQAAYDQNVAAGNPANQPSSSDCGVGKWFESGYTIGGIHLGRWYCMEYVASPLISWHEIEWTQEPLHIITFAAGRLRTWADFVSFTDELGPLP
jgi:hypothetical protein